MPTDIARYSIELFKLGGEGAGIEEILDRHADLKIARSRTPLKSQRARKLPKVKALMTPWNAINTGTMMHGAWGGRHDWTGLYGRRGAAVVRHFCANEEARE